MDDRELDARLRQLELGVAEIHQKTSEILEILESDLEQAPEEEPEKKR